MKIAIFNVKYSPNLGDGLLSECLEQELLRCGEATSVVSIDLAGREKYSLSAGRARAAQMRVLALLPPPLRLALVGRVLDRRVTRTFRPVWRRAIASADVVVVGGGNLFADADVNFPTKIAGALAEAKALGKPVAVFGVGATDNWTPRGAALFEAGLSGAQVRQVAVRDAESKAVWDRRLGRLGLPPAEVCGDPGLLASLHFEPGSGPFQVGICITSPLALKYHSPADQGFGRLESWTRDLVALLTKSGWPVRLFTNGSPEDVEHLVSVGPALAGISPLVSVEERFRRPADLARFVSRCGLIVAHRMHACIAAYSFGVPHIGLKWDRKLESFFASVDRSRYLIDPEGGSAEDAFSLARECVTEGVDPTIRTRVIDGARGDVAKLYASLSAAVGR